MSRLQHLIKMNPVVFVPFYVWNEKKQGVTLARLWTLMFCLKHYTDKSLHQNIALSSQWEERVDLGDHRQCPLLCP